MNYVVDYPVTEFLKLVTFKDKSTGYPLWMLNSLLFQKPWHYSTKLEFDHVSGAYVSNDFKNPFGLLTSAAEFFWWSRGKAPFLNSLFIVAHILNVSSNKLIEYFSSPAAGGLHFFRKDPVLRLITLETK